MTLVNHEIRISIIGTEINTNENNNRSLNDFILLQSVLNEKYLKVSGKDLKV